MIYFVNLIYLLFGFTNSISHEKVFVIRYEYSQKMELDENLRRSYPPEILEQINEAANRTYDFKLISSKIESIMILEPKISNSQKNASVEIEPDLKWVYKNLNENYLINLEEVDKKYYVQDSIENIKWNETQDKKDILGYSSRKLSHENENQIIEIWQAENIKIPNGPLNFGGNENLILEVSVKSKQGGLSWKYTAAEISTLKNYNFKTEIPKNIILKKDFDEIYSKFQEKSREMREQMDLD